MITLVAQIGSNNAKIGYAGESRPRISTESLLIEPQQKHYPLQDDELFLHRQHRQLAYNFDTLRKDAVIQDIFERVEQDGTLGIGGIRSESYCKFLGEIIAEAREGSHGDCGLLLVQPANMKKHQINQFRETLCQYLFNELNINSVYFLKSAVSNCLAQGSPNGIVLDSGQNFTTIARVHDTYQQSSITLNFGGNLISAQIQQLLINNSLGASLTDYQHEGSELLGRLVKSRRLKEIKEKLSKEMGQIESQRIVEIQLPDKQTISIDKQLLGDPFTRVKQFKEKSQFVLPTNYRGLAQIVTQYLQDSKQKYKESLSKYIILAGGNFMYRELSDRTQSSIRRSAAIKGIEEVQLIQNSHKLFSSWLGGSIVASLPSFSPYWITNREWRESGPGIVAKKCP